MNFCSYGILIFFKIFTPVDDNDNKAELKKVKTDSENLKKSEPFRFENIYVPDWKISSETQTKDKPKIEDVNVKFERLSMDKNMPNSSSKMNEKSTFIGTNFDELLDSAKNGFDNYKKSEEKYIETKEYLENKG